MEPATAGPARPPARRSRECPGARGDLARQPQGAPAQPHTLLCIEESGFYPLPRVGRTAAPVGQRPILREGWPPDHLSAIGALAPEGKLSFHGQDHAINATAVVAFLAPLRREVSGQMVLIWDGAPRHRRHVIHAFLAHGAAPRLPLERLPADAPERNPGEGLWAQLQGVERRHLCGFTIPHRRHARRDAVKRVRRKPRRIESFFRGAKL